ncbi:MAG: hypothetical protein ACXAEU_06600 [Candidatus Hodarchaeales archaeon]
MGNNNDDQEDYDKRSPIHRSLLSALDELIDDGKKDIEGNDQDTNSLVDENHFTSDDDTSLVSITSKSLKDVFLLPVDELEIDNSLLLSSDVSEKEVLEEPINGDFFHPSGGKINSEKFVSDTTSRELAKESLSLMKELAISTKKNTRLENVDEMLSSPSSTSNIAVDSRSLSKKTGKHKRILFDFCDDVHYWLTGYRLDIDVGNYIYKLNNTPLDEYPVWTKKALQRALETFNRD